MRTGRARVLLHMMARVPGQLAYDLFAKSRSQEHLDSIYLRWARYTLDLYGVRIEVQGREQVPTRRPLVVVSNHQSFVDIPALVAGLETPLGFVAKKELGRVPILNHWMRRVGCVFIDRSNRIRAHQSVERVSRELGEHPMVLFPEGTRSTTGDILPLKVGGMRMALLAGAQVLPVFLEGTRAAYEDRRKGVERYRAKLTVFPPMATEGLPDTKGSLLGIRDYVEGCWRSRLQAQGPGAPPDRA